MIDSEINDDDDDNNDSKKKETSYQLVHRNVMTVDAGDHRNQHQHQNQHSVHFLLLLLLLLLLFLLNFLRISLPRSHQNVEVLHGMK